MAVAPVRTRSAVAAHPVTSAAIALLVAVDIFLVLWVPLYARLTPKWGDFPFFYWYLLIIMPVTSLLLWVAATLQKRLTAPAGPVPAETAPPGAVPASEAGSEDVQ
ncbi:MAG TPA: DUF3311 domain-containing protein [Trebonia sp.]|jgi:hypothetical protein